MNTRKWTVEVELTEQDGTTQATARLQTEPNARVVTGEGTARLSPEDDDVPEIGDELATSRALTDLAGQLLHVSADDISAATHERVTLLR